MMLSMMYNTCVFSSLSDSRALEEHVYVNVVNYSSGL